MKKKSVVISLAASAAVWGAAFGLEKAGEYLFSGLVLILLAAAEYLFVITPKPAIKTVLFADGGNLYKPPQMHAVADAFAPHAVGRFI